MGYVEHLAIVETAMWRESAAQAKAIMDSLQCAPLRRKLAVTFDAPAQRQPTSKPRPNARKNRDPGAE